MSTGNTIFDTLMLGLVAVLGWLAEHLRQRYGAKPAEPQPTPPVAATFVGEVGKSRKVSLSMWLSVLVMFMPAIKDLIGKALDALAARLGREPTPAEALDAAEKAAIEYVSEQRDRRRSLFGGDLTTRD